jgi:hypothetical protein
MAVATTDPDSNPADPEPGVRRTAASAAPDFGEAGLG